MEPRVPERKRPRTLAAGAIEWAPIRTAKRGREPCSWVHRGWRPPVRWGVVLMPCPPCAWPAASSSSRPAQGHGLRARLRRRPTPVTGDARQHPTSARASTLARAPTLARAAIWAVDSPRAATTSRRCHPTKAANGRSARRLGDQPAGSHHATRRTAVRGGGDQTVVDRVGERRDLRGGWRRRDELRRGAGRHDPGAAAPFSPLAVQDGVGFEYAHLTVAAGAHGIEGEEPFGITVVG